ncbi:hypothetical protein KQI30_04070 [Clostridium bornimense]|uniref:hypothetical protein n=1 Tax=Clostridium bornimense TaxID=1216932 RepID=UPI001C0FF49E|nr:hypothetical protein [Clostridium bornimense]MBU5315454.1 hypothetical protein [Clostridium bornimense]
MGKSKLFYLTCAMIKGAIAHENSFVIATAPYYFMLRKVRVSVLNLDIAIL